MIDAGVYSPEIGDRVRHSGCGSLGTVVEIPEGGVNVEWDDGPDRQYCNPTPFLEPVPSTGEKHEGK